MRCLVECVGYCLPGGFVEKEFATNEERTRRRPGLRIDHNAHHRNDATPDDNARDKAISIARKNDPAGDHSAEAVVIYDLQRTGAFGLPDARPASGGKQ